MKISNNLKCYPEIEGANLKCIVKLLTVIFLLYQRLCIGGSGEGARKGRVPPPPQFFFIFMQFSRKIRQIIGWRSPWVGTPSGKSWSRHCFVLYILDVSVCLFLFQGGAKSQGPYSREFTVRCSAPNNWLRMKLGRAKTTLAQKYL